MNFREENLRILSEKNPQFREELEKNSPLELEPFRASSGEITAKRKGIYIHSRIDPVKEADRLIAASADSSTDTVIFFGFGLGYSVESFFRSFPAGRAVVLEPDTEFFLGVLGIRALSSLFKQERLILLVGVSPEKAAGVLQDCETRDRAQPPLSAPP